MRCEDSLNTCVSSSGRHLVLVSSYVRTHCCQEKRYVWLNYKLGRNYYKSIGLMRFHFLFENKNRKINSILNIFLLLHFHVTILPTFFLFIRHLCLRRLKPLLLNTGKREKILPNSVNGIFTKVYYYFGITVQDQSCRMLHSFLFLNNDSYLTNYRFSEEIKKKFSGCKKINTNTEKFYFCIL